MNLRVVVSFLFVLLVIGSIAFLSPSSAIEVARELESTLMGYIVSSAIIFFIIYSLAFGLTVPIAAALAIAAGFFYGIELGTFLVLVSTLAGSLGTFFYARYVNNRLGKIILGSRYEHFFEEAKNHPISFLLSTRFAPFVPFPLAHLIPAEAGIRVKDFLWTTLIGAMPASIAFIVIGSEAHKLAAGQYPNIIPVVIGLVAISVVTLLTIFLRKKLINLK